MQLLSPLAEAGEPEAQFRAAIMYQNGLGVVANEEKAAEMMRAAAEQGFSTATDLADWLVRTLNLPFREAQC